MAGVYSGLIFGIYWIPLRALENSGLHGLWATFVFNATPLLFVLPVILYRSRGILTGGYRFHICAMLMGLGYVFYASAFLYTEVVRAILLFYLMPIWGFLLARVSTGDAITPVRWLSMALGLGGMLVIFNVDTGIPLPKNIGDWMALISGILWAVASLMLLTNKGGNTLNYATMFLFWATLFSGVMALLASQQGVLAFPEWSALKTIYYWIIPFALIVLIPAAVATVFGPAHLNPGIVGLLFMTEISVATATAAWLAGEPFGIREVIGIALITLAGLAEPVYELVIKKPKLAIKERGA